MAKIPALQKLTHMRLYLRKYMQYFTIVARTTAYISANICGISSVARIMKASKFSYLQKTLGTRQKNGYLMVRRIIRGGGGGGHPSQPDHKQM